MECLVQVVKNLHPRFWIEKCEVLIMNKRKWERTEEMKLPIHESIREKEYYKHVEIFEVDLINQKEMKKKVWKRWQESYSKPNYAAGS